MLLNPSGHGNQKNVILKASYLTSGREAVILTSSLVMYTSIGDGDKAENMSERKECTGVVFLPRKSLEEKKAT